MIQFFIIEVFCWNYVIIVYNLDQFQFFQQGDNLISIIIDFLTYGFFIKLLFGPI